MAFADKAFELLSCQNDLLKYTLESSEDFRIFPFKHEIRNQPFLINRDGSPLHYHRWWYNLKELSIRAGYQEYIRPYDIRRGTGNKLDGMFCRCQCVGQI